MSPFRIARIVLLPLVVACGDAAAPTAIDPPELTYDFPITVSAGTTPTISWPGAGGLVLVFTDETENVTGSRNVWGFFSQRDRTFSSPLSYGTMPLNSECGISAGMGYCPTAKPLVKGRTYRVSIGRADTRISSKTFIP